MKKSNYQLWFWQEILSPHMGALAAELAELGYKVIFVANEILSKDRIKQGWEKAKLGKAKLRLATNKDAVIRLAEKAPKQTIHFCQGLRGNGLVSNAQKILRKRDLRHWAMLEKIDDRGFKGKIRRVLYRILFLYWGKYLEGILAIGDGTKDWIAEKGIKKNQIKSFAYFLKENKIKKSIKSSKKNIQKLKFRFIFVGQLIKRKNLDILIKAMASLKIKEIELWIIGTGPEKKRLYSLANSLLPGQVNWFGGLSMSKVPEIINQVDCLVLPSLHDGWGAVTSESLMVGTPVICSDACGSSIVVKASKVGGIFLSNNQKNLADILHIQYKTGKICISERQKIARWASCLGAKSGAKYLEQILNNKDKNLTNEPWKKTK
tara:strand:- start:1316 stop:2446 length:1131 start_codon:yes stop_codon:yes gene_type:complete